MLFTESRKAVFAVPFLNGHRPVRFGVHGLRRGVPCYDAMDKKTRARDIEFWVERRDGDSVRDPLVAAGFTALDTQPPEESREFASDGVLLSSAFFDRERNGTFRPQGRWSDWVFPAGSFDAPFGHLDALTVPAMSIEGMLAMKEQFPTLRNGRPLRDKDVRDAALLRDLLAAGSPSRDSD